MIGIAGLLMVLMAGGVLIGALWGLVQWNERRRLVEPRADQAARLGLHYAGRLAGGGHRYSGVRNDRRVAALVKDGVWTVSLRLARPVVGTLGLAGPASLGLTGAQLVRTAGGEWRLEGGAGASRISRRVVLKDETIEVKLRQIDDRDVGLAVGLTEDLVVAIEDAFDQAWVDIGARLGLVPGARVGVERPPLSGWIDERRVEARYRLDGSLEVRAAWKNPRLEGLQIQAREALSEPESFQSPVLDLFLAFEGADPQAVRVAFQDPELTELTLAIVHGHPGSVIHRSAVVLRAQGASDADVPTQIGQVARLSGLLSRA